MVETTRISKFDHNGNLELTWPCVACYGIDVNQATGDVYVTLGPLSLVQQFTSTGTLVRQWGSFGTGNGQFNGQHGIAVDPVTGDVFVWDTGNSRIEVFDGTGVYLRQFGQKGSGPGAFSGVASPGGLAFDSANFDTRAKGGSVTYSQRFTESKARPPGEATPLKSPGPEPFCPNWRR